MKLGRVEGLQSWFELFELLGVKGVLAREFGTREVWRRRTMSCYLDFDLSIKNHACMNNKDYFVYQLEQVAYVNNRGHRVPGRVIVKYIGMTNDVERRELEHVNEGKKFDRLNCIAGPMEEDIAREMEADLLAKFRAEHGGYNPFYNQTRSG